MSRFAGRLPVIVVGAVAWWGASAAAQVPAVQTLEAIWRLETRGSLPQAVVTDPSRPGLIFVALKSGGLGVIDASPANRPPRMIARLPTQRFGRLDVMHLTRRGSVLFLALGDLFAAGGARAGMAVVDIADPRAPALVGLWQSPTRLHGSAAIAVDDRHAYLGAMSAGVMIFDIGDPRAPRLVTTFQPDVHFPRKNPNRIQHPNARGLALVRDRLYVAYDAGGLRVLDIADPAHPREIGRYLNPAMAAKQQAYNNVVLDGPMGFVAVDYAGVEILDFSDLRAIRQVGWWNPWRAEGPGNRWFNSAGHANQVEHDPVGKRIYLSAGDSELQVVDVSSPATPRLVSHYGGAKDGQGVWGVTVQDSVAYLTYINAVVPFRGKWSGVVAVRVR
jgi:hypothetical protein